MSEQLSQVRDTGSDGSSVSARSRLSDIPDTEDNALPDQPPPHMDVPAEGEQLLSGCVSPKIDRLPHPLIIKYSHVWLVG